MDHVLNYISLLTEVIVIPVKIETEHAIIAEFEDNRLVEQLSSISVVKFDMVEQDL